MPDPWPTFPARSPSGVEIDYLSPPACRQDLPRLGLFRALATIPRWAGAYEVTVLHHLAICVGWARFTVKAERLPAEWQLERYAAAHDLHEAILLDLPRPLKALLPEYRVLERLWEAAFHQALGLPWPRPPEIERVWQQIHIQATAVEMLIVGHPDTATLLETIGWQDEVAVDLHDEACETLAFGRPSTLWGQIARALGIEPGFPICRTCGCTHDDPCLEGCAWVDEPDAHPDGPLCSACVQGEEP